ncbi:MAG: hypothetical protein A2261_03035 [Candidatus Magasanikbacteria bacterium RIFOXYA2_FULL_44_8]|uniref:Uncharacterized protein n=1 Tax=Candidatus Magasanikbacteria bacterium RIFOXYA2_FULL_44_8 TaxID=1798696 RepID=A0A1F6NL55_9BACT|nr:MAG: hypothetical protein A2261_03035 [Candidatus Magasanikbacteria bacterium RIFOXYA2_FULL_44_8]
MCIWNKVLTEGIFCGRILAGSFFAGPGWANCGQHLLGGENMSSDGTWHIAVVLLEAKEEEKRRCYAKRVFVEKDTDTITVFGRLSRTGSDRHFLVKEVCFRTSFDKASAEVRYLNESKGVHVDAAVVDKLPVA